MKRMILLMAIRLRKLTYLRSSRSSKNNDPHLFICIILLLCCSCKNEPDEFVIKSTSSGGKFEWYEDKIPYTLGSRAYILTVDSIQYIVITNGDGTAITKHRDLHVLPIK